MMKWIKIYPERLHDVRLARLSERAQLLYFKLYMLAGACDAEGAFIEAGQKMTEADLLFKLRLKDKRLLKVDIKALRDEGLLKVNGHGPYIADWKEEQPDWNKIREQQHERDARRRTRVDNADATPAPRVDNANATREPRPQTKTKTKTKTQTKTQTNPPPTPSAPAKAKTQVVGGLVSSSGSGNLTQDHKPVGGFVSGLELTQNHRTVAKQIEPIWQAISLGNKKLEETISSAAIKTTTYEQARDLSLSALASAYADPNAKNKPAVAAYRLINDLIAPEYKQPRTWNSIPAEALAAANVILSEAQGRKIFKAEDAPEIKAVPMPDDVRLKLKGLSNSKSVAAGGKRVR